MPEREFHEAANIFPLMSDEELQELANDIKANGLQNPIELLDGKVIDGRNRYKACEIAGVTPRVCHVKAIKDPVIYVLSKNLYRRHLTTSQKAMIAAKAREYFDQQAKQRMLAGKKVTHPMDNCPQGPARDQAGKVLNVSGKSVDRATKVLREGTPEVVKAVEEGKVSVSAAAKDIDKTKESSAETMKDMDGVTIPKSIRAIFAICDRFEKYANKVGKLKGEFEADVQENPEAWSAIEPQKRVADLSALRQEFMEAKPYLVCPVCGGEDRQKLCTECNGKGWLSRFKSRTVPIDLRNPQRQKAGLDALTKTSQRAGEETK